MPYADINGARIYYEQCGSGSEAVVFAHGLLMCREMYAAQIEALQAHYRCIAFDCRGHGNSESTRGGYSLDEFAEDAIELIRFLDCAPCHFVGHSLGGFIGLRLALRRPELIRSLVLVNTTAEPEPRDQAARYRLLNLIARLVGLRPVAGQVLPILFGRRFMTDTSRAAEREKWRTVLLQNDRRGVTRSTRAVIERDGIHEKVAAIAQPALVITGSDDVAISARRSRVLHEALSNSRFVELPNVGHSSPIEAPAAVMEAIREFLLDVRRIEHPSSEPDREAAT